MKLLKKFFKLLIVTLLICQIIFTFFNISAKSIDLGRKLNIPSAGISLKVFNNFKTRPISFPKNFSRTKGARKYFKTYELWKNIQTLGKWGNSYITLTVLEMKMSFPQRFGRYISVKNFQNIKNKEQIWHRPEKEAWIKYYTRGISGNTKNIRINQNLRGKYYSLGNKNEELFVFSGSQTQNPIVFHYQIEKKLRGNSFKKVSNKIFDSVSSIKRDKHKKQGKFASRFQNKNISDYRKVIRKLAVQNIKNLKGWRALETRNYIILTNYSQNAEFIKKLERKLKYSRKLFTLFYRKEKREQENISIARVFKTKSEYNVYVGDKYKWTSGVWISSKNELVIAPLARPNKLKKNKFFNTIKHEAFHQYIQSALEHTRPSPWFNEGNADFFEEAEFDKGSIKINLDRGQLKRVRNILKNSKKLNFSKLLKMNYSKFYANSSVIRKNNYAKAWALIYFLIKGAPIIKDEIGHDYTNILSRYYWELHKNKKPQLATKKAWKNINKELFVEDFYKFYTKDYLLEKANNLDIVDLKLKQKTR